MIPPDTKYVAVGDADVAYQVIGEGPSDLLFFNGLGSNVETAWEDPGTVDFLRRLATLRRLILLDRRGTGASDGVPRNAIPTWEEWTEDIESVLNAVGSERVSILATVDAGPIAILYAAAHPERVDSLLLCNTSARYLIAEDYPIGFTPEALDFVVEFIRTHWGTPEFLSLAGAAEPQDPVNLSALARLFRSSVTPRTAAAQYDYLLRNLDVRPVLPLLRVPTLVLSADNQNFLPMSHGQYLAEHIEGSKFVALPGSDMLIFGQRDLVFDEVAEFLTGTRPITDTDRVLVTVLFTDIVGSTERASSLGDRRWRTLLDRHDQLVREQLRTFRGREVNTTGDGFVAAFDGPARAIRCGLAIVNDATRALDIELRAGLHTGECEVRGDDLGGLAVHIAARVASLASPSEVLVSGTVKDLVVGSGIEFKDRGEHVLKGVPGNWKIYAAS
jgi:class 3 adenylate cyclase